MKLLQCMVMASAVLGLMAWQSSVGLAQDTQTGQRGIQSPGESSNRGTEEETTQATVAQVGAGTTSGSTTGNSGPQKQRSGAPGEITVPPLPQASLCDNFLNTAAHQSCLSVVLRQSRS